MKDDAIQVDQTDLWIQPGQSHVSEPLEVVGALHNPNGLTLNRKVPRRIRNVVLSESLASISTW